MEVWLVDIIRIFIPLFMIILGWYIWSLKQRFVLRDNFDDLKKEVLNKVNREDYKEFKKEYYHVSNDLKTKLVKIETHMENMVSSVNEIKELFKKG